MFVERADRVSRLGLRQAARGGRIWANGRSEVKSGASAMPTPNRRVNGGWSCAARESIFSRLCSTDLDTRRSGDCLMCTLVRLIDLLLNLYSWVLVIYIILGLLMAFGVVNAYNRFVNIVYEALQKITEPLLRPIRRMLPDTGAVDLSPIIIFIGIFVLRSLLREYAFVPACRGVIVG